ncbi:hypothetical protein FHS42_005999 [Streptomyces zagrosensis]|uniref:Uncharacterized protein n=1 Tax=Streptomyces zagrosensis TaxID=1042984 RepID=A0A7W9QFS0_9ACTN|nr:hypothetical protein [Streptomyces zagrosensis]
MSGADEGGGCARGVKGAPLARMRIAGVREARLIQRLWTWLTLGSSLGKSWSVDLLVAATSRELAARPELAAARGGAGCGKGQVRVNDPRRNGSGHRRGRRRERHARFASGRHSAGREERRFIRGRRPPDLYGGVSGCFTRVSRRNGGALLLVRPGIRRSLCRVRAGWQALRARVRAGRPWPGEGPAGALRWICPQQVARRGRKLSSANAGRSYRFRWPRSGS